MVTEAATSETSTSQYALIFELEGAAVDGRSKLFEAAKAVFQKAGVKLNENQFARHCTHGSTPSIVDNLIEHLGGEKLNDDAAETILTDYTARIKNGTTIHPLFLNLLKEAKRRGIHASAISVLPEEVAQGVLEKSGLAGHGVELHSFAESERHFPRVDCWMKVSRQVAKTPRACIAIAGTRDSGKSALSSGMRCVIIPDQFTAYQDFSGVDIILENSDDYTPSALFNILT